MNIWQFLIPVATFAVGFILATRTLRWAQDLDDREIGRQITNAWLRRLGYTETQITDLDQTRALGDPATADFTQAAAVAAVAVDVMRAYRKDTRR